MNYSVNWEVDYMNNSFLNNLDNGPVHKLTDRNMFRKNMKWIGLLVLFIVIILTIIFTTKTATAKNDNFRIKQVTCIQIKKGDTLWSIASQYMSSEYKDLNEYIEEIKLSNGLTSDKIHAGNFIIVPYYVDLHD